MRIPKLILLILNIFLDSLYIDSKKIPFFRGFCAICVDSKPNQRQLFTIGLQGSKQCLNRKILGIHTFILKNHNLNDMTSFKAFALSKSVKTCSKSLHTNYFR